MNYRERYTLIIEQLKRGERALFKLTPELLLELKSEWPKALASTPPDTTLLAQIFCLLNHTQNSTFELNDLFEQTFQKLHDHESMLTKNSPN